MNHEHEHEHDQDDEYYNEDGVIQSDEVEILDDKWEPSEDDVVNYAIRLGFEVENDPPEFLNLAYQFLKAPLPPNIKRAMYKQTDDLVYIDLDENEILAMTEIEEYAHQAYLQEKERYLQHIQEEKTKGKKVIPNTKVPPIAKKTEKEPKKKNMPKNESVANQSSPPAEMNKNPNKKTDEQQLNLKYDTKNKNKNKSSENENEMKNEDVITTSSVNNKTQPKKTEEEVIKSKSSSSLSNKPEVTSSPISIQISNETKQKEYYNLKLQELRDYGKAKREDYLKKIAEYKKIKQEAMGKYSEEYERKVILEKRKIKDDQERSQKLNLMEQEREFEKNLENDKKCYKEQLEKETRDWKTPGDTEYDQVLNNISVLTNVKNLILKDIDIAKASTTQSTQENLLQQADFNEAKFLLEEKFAVKKKNVAQKYEMLFKEIEIQEEKDYNKEIENSQLSASSPSLEMSLNSSHAKMLDEYQKALEEGYEIKTMSFHDDFKEKAKNELFAFKCSMEKELLDGLSAYKKEILELEKEYYTDLARTREKFKNKKIDSDNLMKHKFDTMIQNYETLKKNVVAQINSTVTELVEKLKSFIENCNVHEKYYIIETALEEYVMNILDDKILECQRKKNSYDILEVEYKEKAFLMDYFLDVGSSLSKMCIEKPFNFNLDYTNRLEMEDRIINDLIRISQEKSSEYKMRYSLIKDKKIFEFLDCKNTSNIVTGAQNAYSYRNKSELEANLQENSEQDSKSLRAGMNIKLPKDISKVKSLSTERYYTFNEDANQEANAQQVIPQGEADEHIQILSLPVEITRSFNEEDLSVYLTIIKFLQEEEAIFQQNVMNKNEKVYSCKLGVFNQIKNNIEDVFNYILCNINYSDRKSSIREKLGLIISNITDYANMFLVNNNERSKSNSDRKMEIQTPVISKEVVSNFHEEKMNVSVKSLKNSIGNKFPIEKQASTLTNPNPSVHTISFVNVGNVNNHFTNFYTLYNKKSLQEEINS